MACKVFFTEATASMLPHLGELHKKPQLTGEQYVGLITVREQVQFTHAPPSLLGTQHQRTKEQDSESRATFTKTQQERSLMLSATGQNHHSMWSPKVVVFSKKKKKKRLFIWSKDQSFGHLWSPFWSCEQSVWKQQLNLMDYFIQLGGTHYWTAF